MSWFLRLFRSRGQNGQVHVLRTKRCPICQSFLVTRKESGWHFNEHGKRTYHAIGVVATCPACQKLTVADPFVPDNNNEPMRVAPYQPDWVKCPHCGIRFSLLNTNSWSGERHKRCGQRLIIEAV